MCLGAHSSRACRFIGSRHALLIGDCASPRSNKLGLPHSRFCDRTRLASRPDKWVAPYSKRAFGVLRVGQLPKAAQGASSRPQLSVQHPLTHGVCGGDTKICRARSPRSKSTRGVGEERWSRQKTKEPDLEYRLPTTAINKHLDSCRRHGDFSSWGGATS